MLGEPHGEHAFVQPVADERVIDVDGDPADVAAARESIRLAFVAALQHLPARQRSVLILCEVLRWQATEVAELLDTSVASVNSALQRARATVAAHQGEQLDDTVDPEQQALLARYVDAFERYDIPRLVAPAARRRRSCRCRRSTCGWSARTTSPAGSSARASCARTAGCCLSRSTAPPASATTTSSRPGLWEPWAIQVIEVADGRIVGHHNFLYPELFAAVRAPAAHRGVSRAGARSLVPAGEPPPAVGDVWSSRTRDCDRDLDLRVVGRNALPERGRDARHLHQQGRGRGAARASTARSIVADNGSTDGSQEIAAARGARVVRARARATATPCRPASRPRAGVYVDDGRRRRQLRPRRPRAVRRRSCATAPTWSWATASRAASSPGAMPALHRYLGNPVLSFLGRLFFRVPIHDFHCGMRGFRRDRMLDLGPAHAGMEFASEMVVRAALAGLDDRRGAHDAAPDGRSRPPHLRTWRDGWRHLRFLLVFSPRWLFLYPALLLIVLPAPSPSWPCGRARPVGDLTFDVQTMIRAATASVVGLQAGGLALVSRVYGFRLGLLPRSDRVERILDRFTLEWGLVVGAVMDGRRRDASRRRRAVVGTDFGRLSTDDMRPPVAGHAPGGGGRPGRARVVPAEPDPTAGRPDQAGVADREDARSARRGCAAVVGEVVADRAARPGSSWRPRAGTRSPPSPPDRRACHGRRRSGGCRRGGSRPAPAPARGPSMPACASPWSPPKEPAGPSKCSSTWYGERVERRVPLRTGSSARRPRASRSRRGRGRCGRQWATDASFDRRPVDRPAAGTAARRAGAQDDRGPSTKPAAALR